MTYRRRRDADGDGWASSTQSGLCSAKHGVEIVIDVTAGATAAAETEQRGSRQCQVDWMIVVHVFWSVSVR